MGRTRGVVSFSLAVAAAAQLLYNPAGYAQTPPAGAGDPEGQPRQDNNVAIPPPAPLPPGAAPGRVVTGPVVTLRADTPKAQLQIEGQQQQWLKVCVPPCNVAVNPAGVYRIAGGTIRPSDSFSMPRPSGQVLIETHYGSNIKHWIGVALIIGGLVSIVAGGYYHQNADELSRSSTSGGMSPDYYRAVGIGSIIHGVIAAGVGFPLALDSTSVEVR